MADDHDDVVALHAETVSVGKRPVERGRVRVSSTVSEREEIVRQALEQEDVEVVRVPVDREVDARPDIRQDGATTIIPIVEEVLVIERRLVLREEIHVRKTIRTQHIEQPVTLRSENAVIEHLGPSGTERSGPEPPIEE